MSTENKIEFVQQLVFTITKAKLTRVLENVSDDGDVKITVGITSDQKIHIAASPFLAPIDFSDDSQADATTQGTEQKIVMAKSGRVFSSEGSAGNSGGEMELGCPNPPGGCR